MQDRQLSTRLDAVLDVIVKQVAPSSQRIYRLGIGTFIGWMQESGYTPYTISRENIVNYRSYLQENYQRATAGRMWSIAHQFMHELIAQHMRDDDPMLNLTGFKVARESTHTALTKEEVARMLKTVDRTTSKGKRDYALLMLLVRTGIRRAECAAITVADMKMYQGHYVLIIQHGKGDEPRTVKLPVDVYRLIQSYAESCNRLSVSLDAPLFVSFTKGDRPTTRGISDKIVEAIVRKAAQEAHIMDLTPHGLRATFITLSIEGGAPLEKVQYAAGHADPRTTERYHTRKLNLDDNAVDYIHFQGEQYAKEE